MIWVIIGFILGVLMMRDAVKNHDGLHVQLVVLFAALGFVVATLISIPFENTVKPETQTEAADLVSPDSENPVYADLQQKEGKFTWNFSYYKDGKFESVQAEANKVAVLESKNVKPHVEIHKYERSGMNWHLFMVHHGITYRTIYILRVPEGTTDRSFNTPFAEKLTF